ncbi:MAG TPA: hypothetical protein VIL86_13845 [Tepidisphaeraceae bacterium]
MADEVIELPHETAAVYHLLCTVAFGLSRSDRALDLRSLADAFNPGVDSTSLCRTRLHSRFVFHLFLGTSLRSDLRYGGIAIVVVRRVPELAHAKKTIARGWRLRELRL